MGRPPAFVNKLENYIQTIREKGRKDRTLREIGRTNMRSYDLLEAAGMETRPSHIGRPEVHYLRSCYPTNRGNDRNQQYHILQLDAFLTWCGNTVVKEMGISWACRSIRIKVDWLTGEQMEIIRSSIGTDPELLMIFHLEGDLGLRRCEVSRLNVVDFDGSMVRVLGKGPGEGKPRDVKKHPETDRVLEDYLEHRERMIIRPALMSNPLLEVPNGLMVYHHSGRLGVMQRTALDRRIERIRDLAGIHFGNHTLRRTWGRELWKATVPIETISEMMGHEDVRTTLRYLGISHEDQGEAMARLYERQQQNRARVHTNPLRYMELHQSG